GRARRAPAAAGARPRRPGPGRPLRGGRRRLRDHRLVVARPPRSRPRGDGRLLHPPRRHRAPEPPTVPPPVRPPQGRPAPRLEPSLMRETDFVTGPRGLRLRLCAWGPDEGRAVLVLHGFLEQGAAWDAFAGALG